MNEITLDEKEDLKEFKRIKRLQFNLVMEADDKGYEFNDLELSIMTQIGKAKNYQEAHNAAYAFEKLYKGIKEKIKSTT